MVIWNSRLAVSLRLIAYIVIPIVLLILPADYFDKGESICISRTLFDIECYACGLTRACMHLIHFQFVDAYYFNPLSFVVFPLLACLWAMWCWNDTKLYKKHHLVAK